MAFQPLHRFELTLLPVQPAPEHGAPATFARRVASCIGRELGVPATEHSTSSKAELVRRAKGLGKAAVLRAQRDGPHGPHEAWWKTD